jgi:protein-disulfide isomerase
LKQFTRKSSLALLTVGFTVLGAFSLSACSEGQAKAKPNFVVKDGGKPGVVARIMGEDITEEQLIGEEKMDFFELKKREYDLRMERLNKILIDRIIGAEAKKANMALEEYIDKKVAKGKGDVSDSEYKKFVKDKKIPESQLNPQIEGRIKEYLKTQKKQDTILEYVAKATKSNPVEVYFSKPRMQVAVEVGGAPAIGKADAPVKVIAFSDFQCPFCARGADTIHEIKKKYGSKVQIAFKHFPLPMHKEATPASEASMCVNEQSTDKFWKFHDLIFKNQGKMSDADLESHAKAVGADMAKFKECFTAKKYKDFVQKDMSYGEKIGVRSTPTFFVNGQLVAGAVPMEQFSELIDDELEAAKK